MKFLYLKTFKHDVSAGGEKNNQVVDGVLTILLAGMVGFTDAIMLFLILDPNRIMLLGSVWPPDCIQVLLKTLLYTMHDVCTWNMLCYSKLCLSGCLVLNYLFCVTLFDTNEFRVGMQTFKYGTKEIIRSDLNDLVNTYGSFQLLHKYFNRKSFSVATIMLENIYSCFVLVTNYAKIPLIVCMYSTWF